MSETTQLVVPTAFEDIAQLADGLAERVEEGKIMLYGPEAVPDDALVAFQVILLDGSLALEGTGRVVTSIDGGDERPEVARYDLVLAGLELAPSAEVVFERILMAKHEGEDEANAGDVEGGYDDAGYEDDEIPEDATTVASLDDFGDELLASSMGGGRATAAEAPAEEVQVAGTDEADGEFAGDDATWAGEETEANVDLAPAAGMAVADADDGDWADVDTEGQHEEAYAAEASYGDVPEGTAEVDISEMAPLPAEPDSLPMVSIPPAAKRANMPSAPPSFAVHHIGDGGQVLARRTLDASWYPEAMPQEAPQAGTGLFVFAGGGLPVPEAPPRPDMDPSMCVTPAPRPGQEAGPSAASLSVSRGEHAAYAADESFGEAETQVADPYGVDEAYAAEGEVNSHEDYVEAGEFAEEGFEDETAYDDDSDAGYVQVEGEGFDDAEHR